MSNNSLNYKIQKYTYKLKHAKTKSTAETYQSKLQEYHNQIRINLKGGNANETLQTLGEKLQTQKNQIQKKIEEIGKVSGVNTKDLEIQLKAIGDKIAEIKNRIQLDGEALEKFNKHTEEVDKQISDTKSNTGVFNLDAIKGINQELSTISDDATKFAQQLFGINKVTANKPEQSTKVQVEEQNGGVFGLLPLRKNNNIESIESLFDLPSVSDSI